MRLLLALLLLLLSAPSQAQSRQIVVTFDDLPWAGLEHRVPPDLAEQHGALMRALRRAKVPGTGFVNENKLELDGKPDPGRVAMLQDWLDAGYTLGNHTHGHLDLHAVGLPAYQDDIVRGERVLRRLLAARGEAPRWFRHPFLRAGRSAADKAALADFLARNGYRIAPVTIDNSDWIWARAYDVAREQHDDAALARLHTGFVPYLMAKVDYYERQTQALLGGSLPQVLLLHANALNAATFVELVQALPGRGYEFVTLEQALQHPAYARPDGYTGAYGPSWIHRWAIAEQRPRAFFAGEPETPPWVMALAGVESE
jgi:peptidoglycan/xylan/chitin deacetylase (PgdA/CDA1 family)